MIDLQERVQAFIAQAMQSEKDMLLDHDWTDTIASYYRDDILKALAEYLDKEFSSDQQEAIIDWLVWNQDSVLKYVGSSNCLAVKGEYAIGSVGEIEIPMEYFPGKITPMKKEAINRFTDLYIADNCEYGYINCEYDYIAIDFTCIDINEALEG